MVPTSRHLLPFCLGMDNLEQVGADFSNEFLNPPDPIISPGEPLLSSGLVDSKSPD